MTKDGHSFRSVSLLKDSEVISFEDTLIDYNVVSRDGFVEVKMEDDYGNVRKFSFKQEAINPNY